MSNPMPPAANEEPAVEVGVELTLVELSRVGGCSVEQVQLLVREGVLEPRGDAPEAWRFDAPALERLRRALRLMRDFELNPTGLLLAMDLLDEVRELRAQLRRLGQ
jgi:chaperone modulatory protein CbpM